MKVKIELSDQDISRGIALLLKERDLKGEFDISLGIRTRRGEREFFAVVEGETEE